MGASLLTGYEQPAFKAETADDLRELLTQAELIVANLRGAGSRAQTLLFLMDTIQGLMARLLETGVDLRAEATRIETIERLLLSKDGVLVREMQRLGGLARAREQVKPPPAQWWWYLDHRVAERQQHLLRRALVISAGIAAALLIFSLAYKYVFPPDPKQVAVMEKSSQADQAIQTGDLATALQLYREAAEIRPEDPELQIWVGVLAEKLGQVDGAAQAYGAAEAQLADRARFLMQRAMTWLRLGELDRAEADAQASLAANPDLAESYFVLGGIYEARGNVGGAVVAFEKTAELAEKANNSALIVMAKTRLGMLLQAAPLIQPTATATSEAGP
ncbi:MAG: tetratricopeptide repeat protein [Anaerolineae bacterium]|nr:tetratricopeptide repeat protein [Anaerolineae bacterium]